MKHKHKDKDKVGGKVQQTINFDKEVLTALEDKARRELTTISNIVNIHIRKVILCDEVYFKMKAKDAFLEYQKYKYLADQVEAQKEVK